MWAASWNLSHFSRVCCVLRGEPLDTTSLSTIWGAERAAIMATRPPVEKPSSEARGTRSCDWRPSRSEDICLTEGLVHLSEFP